MVKYDKNIQQQLDLRQKRLSSQKALTRNKIKAQQEAIQGYYNEPSMPMDVNLEEELNNPQSQIRIATDNCLKLISNQNEAYKLLELLQYNDIIVVFNTSFPKIYREIKSKYNNLTAKHAFQLIIKIMDGSSDPITNEQFKSTLNTIYKYLTSLKSKGKHNGSYNDTNIEDVDRSIQEFNALLLTFDNVNDEGKEELKNQIDIADTSNIINNVSAIINNDTLNNVYDNNSVVLEDVDEDVDEHEDEDVYNEDNIINPIRLEDIASIFGRNDRDELLNLANNIDIGNEKTTDDKKISTLKGLYKKYGAGYILGKLI